MKRKYFNITWQLMRPCQRVWSKYLESTFNNSFLVHRLFFQKKKKSVTLRSCSGQQQQVIYSCPLWTAFIFTLCHPEQHLQKAELRKWALPFTLSVYLDQVNMLSRYSLSKELSKQIKTHIPCLSDGGVDHI